MTLCAYCIVKPLHYLQQQHSIKDEEQGMSHLDMQHAIASILILETIWLNKILDTLLWKLV